MQENTGKSKVGIFAAIGVVVVATGVAIYSMMGGKTQTNTETPPPPQPVTGNTALPPVSAGGGSSATVSQSGYKDGTYTADGSYQIPEDGPEFIGVTLTIANGVITDVSVTQKADNTKSKLYQGMFADEYKQYVVGKDLATLRLDKVAGSSLTPKGFNAALINIKTQAKA